MRRSSLFWGLILMLVGLALLLDNLGLLGRINVWSLIWPLVLISMGIWILLGSVFRREPALEHAVVPLEGATRARVRFSHGAGRLSVAAGAAPANLMEGDFGGGVEIDTRRKGDQLESHLSVPAQVFPFSWGPGYSLDWNLRLNPELPLELEFETGAGESQIDLSDLLVSRLRLRSGASATRVRMPSRAAETQADFSSGAASLEIEIPSGVAARIRWRGGLSDIRIDNSRFPRTGDVYQSPDYETAEHRIDMQVEMGVGSVKVS